jgi:hypothetical protein
VCERGAFMRAEGEYKLAPNVPSMKPRIRVGIYSQVDISRPKISLHQ